MACSLWVEEKKREGEVERDMSPQQRPFVGVLLNRSSSLISVATENAHQPGPIAVHQPLAACLSLTLSGSVHWSSCCSLQNTSIGQSGSNCLLSDIKALKRLDLVSCVLALVKKRRTTRRKTSLNSPPRLGLQPFILIPVDTCYFFDGKYKALLGNIRRAFDMRAQI